MDRQDGRARSPSASGQYAQNGGANVPTTASFSNAYDAGISPTSTGEQFAFNDQHSYMQNLNAPTFPQGMSGDFQNQSDNNFMIDPSLQAASQPQSGSINPAAIMGTASPTQHSPAHSPSMSQGGHFYSPNHSRNASLDPSSAANMPHQQGQEWSGMLNRPSFQNHRRAPSEHSDISSLSPSPYVKQNAFDYDASRSPMLNAQQDSGVYPENLGIDRFSISDAHQQQQQQQQQQQTVSPRVSPYPSPRMSPQPGMGIPENSFILPSNDGNRMGAPVFNQGGMEMGSQIAPPEINVEFAPPSKQNMDMMRDSGFDGLSPPSRGRPRAHSDPSFPQMSRPLSPGDTAPSLLGVESKPRQRSLSPLDVGGSSSRDPSPNRPGSRRSSTPSIPNRDYILDLADPTRPTASGDGQRARVQKHPATFQCNLCPKRFTRAYNLRSHLRTHTDERPFVCTVCNKAFARQHDRKRHEGLHSGEKKFVCKGDLTQPGQSWGCGRRFARADALGRHFRSEAGRVCIKPLLDEEAVERQRQFEERMMASGQGMHQGGLQPQLQPMSMENGGFTLPQALLAQYPALQGLQWDNLGPGGPDEGDGRSSFDASSGGEFYEDEDPNGGYVSGPGTAYAAAWG